MNKCISREDFVNKLWGYTFLMPSMLLLALFLLFPIMQMFYYSFTDWNGAVVENFVGLRNFQNVFATKDFYTVLRNNLLVLALGVPLWTIFPLTIAILLFDEIKGAAFFKSAFFFPSVLSIVVVGVLFKTMFGYVGPINTILKAIGLERFAIEWLAKGITSLPIIVIAVNWSGFGQAVLIYLAAMSIIDTSMLEAATLDGVTWFQKARYIILPSIKNVVEFTIVLNIIYAFSQMFTYVLAITNGGPGYESTVLEFYIYSKGFGSREMGFASALSVILFAIVCLTNLIQFAVFRRNREGE